MSGIIDKIINNIQEGMMRADRLISIVMLLQTHERMTADELSRELEVSPRTIYRDITSLNVAGIPIYTDRGPGGGIALLESYRTTLTGMNEDETQALFMLSIPQALVELGVDQKLKRALLKLTAALPPRQQIIQAHTQQRIYLDSTPWQMIEEPAPHLAVLHTAVWNDKRVRLVFQGGFDTRIEMEMEPLGLVAKMNTWYLVGRANEFLRVLKIADILKVEALAEDFIREADFDLATFWTEWCAASINRRTVYEAKLRMAPGLVAKLNLYLGGEVKYTISDNDEVGTNDWKVVTILYDNFFSARESILNFGRAAEVLEPYVLRLSVIDYARQIIAFYQEKSYI
jgi:predicted DNA-binding transcriptional regulator YafY